jgi:hypothetical protein
MSSLTAETTALAAPDHPPCTTDPAWPLDRWVRILDRIEHRQPDIGLRFWGPPLWLEVTMDGPDSDRWPAISEQITCWDWQSDGACTAATELIAAGAGDDELLAAVSRYTIENLILNAVHEIGEWLRFDGERLFPAHPPGAESGAQGNGAVRLEVEFEQRVSLPASVATGAHPNPAEAPLVVGVAGAADASRFTYVAGTTISYDAEGPVVHRWSAAPWRSSWSASTWLALATNGADVVTAVARDVHRALVFYEADRICRAFHVDGERAWRLDDQHSGSPPGVGKGSGVLVLSVHYAEEPPRRPPGSTTVGQMPSRGLGEVGGK